MADGKVVIDVILDDGTVAKGVTDINKQMGGLQKGGERAAFGIGKIVTALGLVAVGAKAIGMVTSALDGAISRYDTLNNFPVVLEMMGFSAEESANSINRLSEGIDGLPTTLDSVASTAQRIAIMTGDLDKATETTLALNNAFLSSGSSSADASRGLEQYVQMLAKGQVDLESWRSLQETMPVALNKVAEAFGFTGASAQNDLYDALKEGDVTFDQFNGKLIELSNASGGFAEIARSSSNGIATSWQNMKTAIVKGVTDVIAGIDEALGGVGSIASILDKGKEGVKTFFTFITENIPVAVKWLAKVRNTLEPWLPLLKAIVAGFVAFATINTIVAGVSNAIAVFVGIQKALRGVKLATDAAKASQVAYNAVLAINPWVLLAAAIVAVAVLVYVYWEPIKAFFAQLWEGIKTAGLSLWESLKLAWQSTVAFLISIWTPIQNFFVSLWTAVSSIFSIYWSLIKEYVSVALESIKTIISTWWEVVKTIFAAALLTLVYLVTGQWGKIAEVWAKTSEKIRGLVSSMWEKIRTLWTNFGNEVRDLLAQLVAKAIAKWQELKTKATQKVSELVAGVVKFFAELPGKVVTKLAELATSIYNKFTEIKDEMKTMGADMIAGLISGIVSKTKDLIKSVSDTIGGALEWAKGMLGIRSPSRLMRDMFGRNMMLGYQVGIDKEKNSTIRKMQEAAKWMTPSVSGFVNGLKGVSAPVGGVTPISAISYSKNETVKSTNRNVGSLEKLVGAIDRLASRPFVVSIDGHEFVQATIDSIDEGLNFKKSIQEVF